MKNCNRSPEQLRASILNIVEHYRVSCICTSVLLDVISILQQGRHHHCNEESACRKDGYVPSKIQLRDPAAIEAYTKKLKETLIYANAESYCHVRIQVTV